MLIAKMLKVFFFFFWKESLFFSSENTGCGFDWVSPKFICWSLNLLYLRMWPYYLIWRQVLYRGNQFKISNLDWPWHNMTGVLIRRGNLEVDNRHSIQRNAMGRWRQRSSDAFISQEHSRLSANHYIVNERHGTESFSQSLEGTKLLDTLISDF